MNYEQAITTLALNNISRIGKHVNVLKNGDYDAIGISIDCSPIMMNDMKEKIENILGKEKFNIHTDTNQQYIYITCKK